MKTSQVLRACPSTIKRSSAAVRTALLCYQSCIQFLHQPVLPTRVLHLADWVDAWEVFPPHKHMHLSCTALQRVLSIIKRRGTSPQEGQPLADKLAEINVCAGVCIQGGRQVVLHNTGHMPLSTSLQAATATKMLINTMQQAHKYNCQNQVLLQPEIMPAVSCLLLLLHTG